jgi:uncharacterized NAD-dependent epimerase/dehydratase family protein
VENAYEPKHGHGTGVASILVNNAAGFSLTSYVLFEQKLSVPVGKCVSALEAVLNTEKKYDIVHLSLGVRQYSPKLEALCEQLSAQGTLIISAFDNLGSVSYPAALSTVIGVDASFRCFKKDDFVFVNDTGMINLKAKAGNQRIAWLNNTFVITQGSSFAAAYVTAQCIKLLQDDMATTDILKWFKTKAIYVYPEPETFTEPYYSQYFSIKKAVIFPCNKEVTSILRFPDLLDFELLDVYDTKRSGKTGQKIKGFDDNVCYTVKNIEDCAWDNFDTLILGHTYDLEYFSKEEVRARLLEQCLAHKINVFSFDDDKIDNELLGKFRDAGLHLYYPSISNSDMSLKMGKMYIIKTPVLDILGTSSQQGKFTLQLQLRKRFLRDGYSIGQLGSEPESLLFGMDEVYPFGFRSTISLDYLKSIEYLNYCIAKIDKKQCDIIMAGSQAGTWPMMYNHITNFSLDRLCFLMGTRPDAVILCINYHDKPDDIQRTIAGVEALSKCKVIACSLFPMGYKDDWDMVRDAKSAIPEDNLRQFCKQITDMTGRPCHVLDSDTGPEALYQESIKFFTKK